MKKLAEFTLGMGAKQMFVISAQTPFAQPSYDLIKEHYEKAGRKVVGQIIYEKDKTSFRSECDQIIKAKPDIVYLNGYTPDTIVLSKDLYRAGYQGMRVAQGYAVDRKYVEGVPPEVAEGIYAISPSPALGSRKVLTPMIGRVPSCLRCSYSIDSSWMRPRW